MTDYGTQRRRQGALSNQTISLPRSRADQRQTIADVVVLLLALLLVAALALRLFAGPVPTVQASLLPLGANLLQFGH